MNFRYHLRNGFALVEVMIALSMVAIILTALMMVEGRVFKRSISSCQKMERLVFIKNMFLMIKKDPLEKNEQMREMVLQDPDMRVRYQQKKIKNQSSLAVFKGVQQECVTGVWDDWGMQREYSLITHRFTDIKKKKDKNNASS